jgi:hypothetical protein
MGYGIIVACGCHGPKAVRWNGKDLHLETVVYSTQGRISEILIFLAPLVSAIAISVCCYYYRSASSVPWALNAWLPGNTTEVTSHEILLD